MFNLFPRRGYPHKRSFFGGLKKNAEKEDRLKQPDVRSDDEDHLLLEFPLPRPV
jgi:hypothetical protein